MHTPLYTLRRGFFGKDFHSQNNWKKSSTRNNGTWFRLTPFRGKDKRSAKQVRKEWPLSETMADGRSLKFASHQRQRHISSSNKCAKLFSSLPFSRLFVWVSGKLNIRPSICFSRTASLVCIERKTNWANSIRNSSGGSGRTPRDDWRQAYKTYLRAVVTRRRGSTEEQGVFPEIVPEWFLFGSC